MAYSKLPFLLLTGLGAHVSLTSPNPAPSSSETSVVRDKGQSWVNWGPWATKAVHWTLILGEATAIVARANPGLPYIKDVLPHLARGSPERLQRIGITTPFLVGSALVTFAGFTRFVCYRTLGRFFTFEVALREKHKLVTWGPYGWVRHPSYTASILCMAGIVLTTVGPGSWLREAGWLSGIGGKAAVVGLCGYFAWIASFLIWRTSAEDAFLRKEFGQEWNEWAARVQWRVFPGIY